MAQTPFSLNEYLHNEYLHVSVRTLLLVCLFVCLFVWLFVCLFVCLFVVVVVVVVAVVAVVVFWLLLLLVFPGVSWWVSAPVCLGSLACFGVSRCSPGVFPVSGGSSGVLRCFPVFPAFFGVFRGFFRCLLVVRCFSGSWCVPLLSGVPCLSGFLFFRSAGGFSVPSVRPVERIQFRC